MPFGAGNRPETSASSSSGTQKLPRLGQRALDWVQLARGGRKTCCLPWCSQRRTAELAEPAHITPGYGTHVVPGGSAGLAEWSTEAVVNARILQTPGTQS